jgi:chromosome partitioning protein
MPGKVTAVTLNKGGNGKTTLVVHTAHRAAAKGLRTLVIDGDPQGSATTMFVGHEWESGTPASWPLRTCELYDDHPHKRPPLSVRPNLDLVATRSRDDALSECERLPLSAAASFRSHVEQFAATYDLIFIDTPPGLGFLTLVPLLAAEFALSPVKPESLDLDGLARVTEKLDELRSGANPRLRHLGFVLTMCDGRDRRQGEVISRMRKLLGNAIAPISTPYSIPMKYVVDEHKPIWEIASSGAERSAATAFIDVGDWILKEILGPKKALPASKSSKSSVLRFFRREARP